MQKLIVFLLVTAFLIMQLVLPRFASAVSVGTQLQIPDTVLTITGYASPDALVQIYDSSALIGSVTADSFGTFIKTFPAMSSGLHSLRLQYIDAGGRFSSEVKDTINVRAQQTTTIDYFLPPTIEIIPISVSEGANVRISGSTVPKATVEILVDGGGLTLRPQADSSGNYTITFSTATYYGGEHIAFAAASRGQRVSYSTDVQTFTVEPLSFRVGENPDSLAPPIITNTSPLITSLSPVTVRGLAEPLSQVVVFVDGVAVGSVFSNGEGSWFIDVYLHAASHEVRAIACQDNLCSDFSNLLEIVYRSDTLLAGQPLVCSLSFELSEYRYWGVTTGKPLQLSVTNLQGSAPLEVLVDWGDGIIEQFNQGATASIQLEHTYDKVGQFNASITISDADSCVQQKYFSVSTAAKKSNWQWLLYTTPLLLILLGALIIRQKRREELVEASTVRLSRPWPAGHK